MASQHSLAIVLVHYHTPELAAAAVAALQRDIAGAEGAAAATAGTAATAATSARPAVTEVEWLLVDNGSDAAGREILRRLPVRLLEPGSNLGYAGGVNLGVASSRADFILLMNPDVMVLPGCVAGLVASLAAGAAAAGPMFYWDAGRRLRLPPPEERGRRAELLAAMARLRGGAWAAAARRRSRRHCRRHWLAKEPLASYALSGSLLAVRRDAWQKVGGFDEGFPLYFEETDWLFRLRSAGLPARFVPGAEAVHLYSRSAAAEPQAGAWFEASARRFRERHYGAWFSRLLAGVSAGASPRTAPAGVSGAGGAAGAAGRLAAQPSAAAAAAGPDAASEALPQTPRGGLDLSRWPAPLWVEVTPNAAGFPAAGEWLPNGGGGLWWQLPNEIAASLPAGTWWVSLSGEEGDDLLRRRLGPAAAGSGAAQE